MTEGTTPNAPKPKAEGVAESTRRIKTGNAASSHEASKTTIFPGDTILNTYRIEQVLASGGMGQVYLARHTHLGTAHAIKVIKPELFSNQQVLDLFRREAMVLRDVRNDAVVSYDGFFVDERGRDYLVMEYVEGPSLANVLKSGPLPLEKIFVLRDRLAIGLRAAHAKGVIHRDVSPDNVIFPENRVERAKLIDFGTCKLTAASVETIVGDGFVGKFRFVSPEQAGATISAKVDARSDIYSLGLVLAAAALGSPLDMGDSIDKVILARRQIPDLSPLPEVLQPQIRAMLQPDPEDRPQSVEALIRDWPAPHAPQSPDHRTGPVTLAETEAGSPSSQLQGTQSSSRRTLAVLFVGLLIILGIGSGAYFSVWRSDPTAEREPGPQVTPIGSLSIPELATRPWTEISPSLHELITRRQYEVAFTLLSEAAKNGLQPPPRETYDIAREFLRQGLVEESLVLFKESAQRNHGPSALAIAEMYDPILWGSVPSPFSQPNWFQADKWYRKALALGVEEARMRLQRLAVWKSTETRKAGDRALEQ